MATYKKGHKRSSNDKFFSYVLIGFAITFFIILISMVLFNIFDNTLDYDSFEQVGDYSQIQTMEEDQYLVYWYSEQCSACTIIKEELLQFADSNTAGIKVYFMDADKTSGNNYITQMTGTPSLLTIVNGSIMDLTVGYVDIPLLLEQINSGTYTNIN